MQAGTRRVGEHIEHVEMRFVAFVRYLVSLRVFPRLLPLTLNLAKIIFHKIQILRAKLLKKIDICKNLYNFIQNNLFRGNKIHHFLRLFCTWHIAKSDWRHTIERESEREYLEVKQGASRGYLLVILAATSIEHVFSIHSAYIEHILQSGGRHGANREK